MIQRRAGGTALPILMYHAIPRTRGECRTPLDIPLSEFAAQLDTLAEGGWRVTGLTAALDSALVGATSGESSPVMALTIDDAYADVEGAVDQLLARGMSCTVYVPTDFPDRTTAGSAPFVHPVLSWQGLSALTEREVELGSHSRSHRPLDVLPTATLRTELLDSRRRLRDRTGVLATSLCYPYGYTSSRVRRLAAQAGYANACTVGRRVATTSDPVLALPRLQPLSGMTPAELERLLVNGEPGVAAQVKRYAQPAWRVVRFAALKAGVTLT